MTEPDTAEPRRRMPGPDRRRHILEVARATIVESREGMSGASVRLIAERCGINEALIYRHFGTKENLYFEAVSAQVKSVIEALAERSRGSSIGAGSQERERREWDLTYYVMADLLRLPPETLRAVGMLLFGDQTYAGAFYEHSLAPAVRAVEDVVESEMSNWSHEPFSAAFAVRVLFGTALWHVMESGLTGQAIDPEAKAAELADMVFYGMAGGRPDRPPRRP